VTKVFVASRNAESAEALVQEWRGKGPGAGQGRGNRRVFQEISEKVLTVLVAGDIIWLGFRKTLTPTRVKQPEEPRQALGKGNR